MLREAIVSMEGRGEPSDDAKCGSVEKFGLGRNDEPEVWEDVSRGPLAYKSMGCLDLNRDLDGRVSAV